MGLIVSITLVLGLIFYWEGRRLYKEPEEHSKLQRIAITIKLGGISYLKSLFMLACLIAPAVIMYLIGDAIKDLYDFSKDFKENPSLTDLIDSINHLLLSIGTRHWNSRNCFLFRIVNHLSHPKIGERRIN